MALRIFLLCRSECSIIQEIQIANKSKPDVTANSHKSYSVVYVHYHAAACAQDVKLNHLDVFDAMIALHLATGRLGYQGLNSFFQTYIKSCERNILKVFHIDKEWECGTCNQKTLQCEQFCCARCSAMYSGLWLCVVWKLVLETTNIS